MNKNGVSGRWFTKAVVEHFQSGALRTITNTTRQNEKKNSFTGKFLTKMQISSQVLVEDFKGLRNQFVEIKPKTT